MADHIVLKETSSTPYFEFDFDKGIMKLEGRSIPEDALKFYIPLYELAEEYVKKPAAETRITVKLEYFTTSSAKCLLDLFKKMEPVGESGCIIWHYEEGDEDLEEAGKAFNDIVDLRFEFVQF